jgi:hypothetical protein
MDPEVGDLKNGVVVIEDGRITEINKGTIKSVVRKIKVKKSNEIRGFLNEKIVEILLGVGEFGRQGANIQIKIFFFCKKCYNWIERHREYRA